MNLYKKLLQHTEHVQRRHITFIGGILQTFALLISLSLATTFPSSPDNYVYTSVLTALFAIMGSVIFLKMRNGEAAGIAYGFFVCSALTICLLNISEYSWIRMLTAILSMIIQGLAVTFVCVVSNIPLPLFSRSSSMPFSQYIPLLLSTLLAFCNLFTPLLFPAIWPMLSLVIYGFSLFCMLIVIWGILWGFQRLQAQDQSVASIAVIGIILVLVSFTINSNNTLYKVPLLPTSVGFLLLYTSLVACGALILSVTVWGIHSWLTQSLHLGTRVLMLVSLSGIALALLSGIVVVGDIELLRQGLSSLINHHPFILPIMILPSICYAAMLHNQLTGKAGFLSRRIMRGMLWFSLASCLIWIDFLINEVGNRYLLDPYDRLFLHIGWFMLSLGLFPWLWEKARAVGDRMLYRDFYSYNRTLRNLSLALTRLRSFEQICNFILPQLTTLLNAKEVALLTRNESCFQERSGKFLEPKAHPWNCFYFSPLQKEITATIQSHFIELVQSAQHHLASSKEMSYLSQGMLLLPLYEESVQQGFLCLGPKLNGEAYDRQDLSFLETLTAQLATLEGNIRYAEQLRKNAQQMTALSRRIMQAQEEERRRLALEIHDDALQQAMLLTRQLTDASNDPQVATNIPLARSIVQTLRTTCLELRPPLLNELGLIKALQWLCQQVERQGSLRVQIEYIGEQEQRMRRYAELMLYRIAQEALSNVLKHASAQIVRVRLRQTRQGAISLIIADNGYGWHDQEGFVSDHLGLVGMEERMESIGGRLQIRSSSGRGFVVRAVHRSLQETTDENVQEEHRE